MEGGKVLDNQALTDQLEKFRQGDQEAFRKIYTELKTPVYTIIYRILYDKILSEDVVQEIFLKLSQTPPPPKVKKPRAWIFQMSRNLAIDYKRKTRETTTFIEETQTANVAIEDSVSTRVDVEKALQHLSESEREIVTLRLNAELKFKDIAELTETPLGTVLWKYRQSIKQLRTLLAGKD